MQRTAENPTVVQLLELCTHNKILDNSKPKLQLNRPMFCCSELRCQLNDCLADSELRCSKGKPELYNESD